MSEQTTMQGGPATGRPPLRRPAQGRILAGVGAGLADHLGWDVTLVRILIVVVTLITQGLGLLVYIAAAVLMPAAGPGDPRPAQRADVAGAFDRRPASFWVGVGLLVLGVLWLVSVTPVTVSVFPGLSLGAVAVPLLLIAFGMALWVTGERHAADRPPAGAAAAPPSAAGAHAAPPSAAGSAGSAGVPAASTAPGAAPVAARPPDTSSRDIHHPKPEEPAMATRSTTTSPGAADNPPPPPTSPTGGEPDWTPPPAPERTSSVLARGTIGLALVTVGVLWILRLSGVAISAGQMLAAALLVVGLGLLVGSVAGRGRSLIWLGVFLLPLVLVAQVPANGWFGGVASLSTDSAAAGEFRVTPQSFDELAPTYEIGAGSVRIDLTELPFDGEELDLEVSVGAGEIRVIVPDDVTVDAVGSVGIGQVRMVERSAGGLGVGDVEVGFEPDDPRGSVTLDLSAGLGDVRLDRVAANP